MVTIDELIAEIRETNLFGIYRCLFVEAKYPQWRKYCVKRKYDKHQAQYIDMLYTHERTVFEDLPKTKLKPENYKFNVI